MCDLLYQRSCRKPFDEFDTENFAAVAHNEPAAHDILDLPVAALYQHIGSQRRYYPLRRILGKNNDMIDRLKRRDDGRALLLCHGRPAGAFQPFHGVVAIDPDDEDIPFVTRRLKIRHMAEMQDIETTVGKNDSFPAALQGAGYFRQSAKSFYLGFEAK